MVKKNSDDDILQPLRERYLKNLAQNKETLKPYLASTRNKPLSDKDRTIIRDLAHQALGTGKIFGFPEITKTGSALETHLLSDPPSSDKVILQSLKKFLNACETACKTKIK